MTNLSVKFGEINFKNPVVMASGTFGFGKEYNEIYDIETKNSNLLEIIYLNNDKDTEIVIEVIYSDGSNMSKSFNIEIDKYKFYLGF